MNGIPEATPIRLTEEERAELLSLARSTKTEYRMRQRARIVLLAAEGMASRAIGREVGCTTGTASKWRGRYARDRLAGLDETGDRGAEPKYTVETDKRILAVLDRPVPAGHGRWSGPLIAAELGDVDVQYVWRFLRAQKIDLTARKSWCESNDPAFAAKAAEIVGLYLDPPDGALVLAVGAKPSIQALERAQGIAIAAVSRRDLAPRLGIDACDVLGHLARLRRGGVYCGGAPQALFCRRRRGRAASLAQ